jgi:transcriptional regulator with XRE-family HTH domain
MFKLTKIRKERGLSKTQLSYASKVNLSAISRIELEKQTAFPGWQERIADVLGVAIDELFTSDGWLKKEGE